MQAFDRRPVRRLGLLAIGAVFLWACGGGTLRPNDGGPCGAGLSQCGGGCSDLQSDPNNCGVCGTLCPAPVGATPACASGACAFVCPTGLTGCGNGCVDPSSDPANCGSCGVSCPKGELCSRSACAEVCATGELACDGGCVTPIADPKNCGGCGVLCPQGQGCVAGHCQTVCGSGTSACDGGCASLQTDPANCGGCGLACPAGAGCASGHCGCSATSCGAGASCASDGGCSPCEALSACGSDCRPCPPLDGGQVTCAGNVLPAARSCLDSCPAGTKLGGGATAPACIPCSALSACGSDCGPCPTAPPGGTATCSGNATPSAQACTLSCNSGYRASGGSCAACLSTAACGSDCQPCPSTGGMYLCSGNSAPASSACELTSCPAGQHEVGGSCTPCTTTANCGSDCAPCPVPPPHGSYACAGNSSPAVSSCTLSCAPGFLQSGGSCLCPSPNPADGGSYTLNADPVNGSDSSGNGSSVCPFATITQALSVATAAGNGTGPQVSRIALAPGTYARETFPLTVSTATRLVGSSAQTTVIDHVGAGLAVWLDTQGAGLSGVTLQGDGNPSSIGVEAYLCGEALTGSVVTGFGRGLHEWITTGTLPCVTIDSNAFTDDLVAIQLDGSSAEITNNSFTGGGVFIQDDSGLGSFPVHLAGNSFTAISNANELCPEPDVGAACCGGSASPPPAALASGVAICIQGSSGATLDANADGGNGNNVSGAKTALLFLSNGGTLTPADAGPPTQPTLVNGVGFTGNADYGVWVGSGGQTWAIDLGSMSTIAGLNTFSCNGAADVWLGNGTGGTLTAEFNDWDHSPPSASKTCSGGVDTCTAGSSGKIDTAYPTQVSSPCP
ncbi:MAG: DUF1565 domain-containing protein [Deltaproteobacteria bacterium]